MAVLVHWSNQKALPPVVVSVTPSHDALIEQSEDAAISVSFESAVRPGDVDDLLLDGQSILPAAWCSISAGCNMLTAHTAVPLKAGPHNRFRRLRSELRRRSTRRKPRLPWWRLKQKR